jgi:TonB-dependent starch-binding outer membrane protein SusC
MQLTGLFKVFRRKLGRPFTYQSMRVMKMTVFILFAAYLQVSANSEAQTVTLSKKNATLKSIFAEIRKQTGYDFFYEEKVIKDARRVNIEVTNASIEEALDICLDKQGISYLITGTTVVLKRKELLKANIDQVAISQNDSIPRVKITGRVQLQDSNRVVLENVNVLNLNTGQGTTTGAYGDFNILARKGDVLIFSYVGLKNQRVKFNSADNTLIVNLERDIQEQEAVSVYNTGYQQLPKERATGSFEHVSNSELNRRIGSDILSRLEGVSTSVFFDKRGMSPSATTIQSGNIIIRGLSTVTEAIKSPLIVVNNFPYDGDINNINPNDVESITILKDAAAASIWGARAGNGVIIITTKSGRNNQGSKISLNTNLTVAQKPDLFYYPKMSTSEYIDVEKFLFEKGYYEDDIYDNFSFPVLSPVVEILTLLSDGSISASQAEAEINKLRNLDIRNDFDKYVYRRAISQQYSLGISGGTEKNSYSISGGYDRGLSTLKGNQFERVTFRGNNSLRVTKALEANIGIAFSNIKNKNNSLGELGSVAYSHRAPANLYPYAQFADENGNSLPILKDYRKGFTDTAGKGKLLNWQFYPLDEMKFADESVKLQDVTFNLGIHYKFTNWITAQVGYQYESAFGYGRSFKSKDTYFTRNLINRFTSAWGSEVKYAIPKGGILDEQNFELRSHNIRGQIFIDKSWSNRHTLAIIAGGEIKDRKNTSASKRTYGFDKESLLFTNVDYASLQRLYGKFGYGYVPNNASFGQRQDRFVSYYGNASYTLDKKYVLSLSARKDASNVFGIDINDKWNPFWSIGGAWDVSNESFYSINLVPFLRLRATYGYQGNVNNSLSPYTIITRYQGGSNYPPFALISNSADPSLSWETIRQINAGLDFRGLNNRLNGSFEIYRKSTDNLLFRAVVDPTTGLESITRNSAKMVGNGIDVTLNFLVLKSAFQWQTDILFSYINTKIKDYQLKAHDIGTTSGYVSRSGMTIMPVKGRSPYSLYSYPFAGLDPNTGDPIGYLNKTETKDYRAIMNQSMDTAQLIYHGSAIPTHFGFFNNTFGFKGLTLSMSISYRFNYFFRKSTIGYSALYSSGRMHPDFSKRWQKSGDEEFTSVPSMVYPLSNSRRDDFYAGSSVNVLKGDNVRLDYLRLSYSLTQKRSSKINLSSIQVYAVVNNIGILWRANREDLDPDYDSGNGSYPPVKAYTLGLKLEF